MNLQTHDVFGASIHEIKNLLGQVMMGMDQMGSELAALKDNATFHRTRFACHRLSEHLQQLLLLYKMESDAFSLALDAHSPPALIDEIAAEANSIAAGTPIAIGTSLAADLPPFAFFDRGLIELALFNAIHNGLSHARSTIGIAARAEGGMLVLSVEDDGPGYPQETLDRDWTSIAHDRHSSGLGLRFAIAIAQAHQTGTAHGRVELSNGGTLGGARFELWVPA
ncbi:MAG: HAMP domain-containing histidine kinase [Sulfuricellaceae bacterium]|nr:HAMP domain-containing histidine kinase [Sulfuricellaceae bacterium]